MSAHAKRWLLLIAAMIIAWTALTWWLVGWGAALAAFSGFVLCFALGVIAS